MYSRCEDVDKVCDRCRSDTKFCVFTSPDVELTDPLVLLIMETDRDCDLMSCLMRGNAELLA